MLRHVVLLTWTEGATEADRAAVVSELRRLPDLIPVIESYEVRVDAGLASGNADLVVDATFADAEAWRSYTDHPEHQRVLADHIRPILDGRAALQIEV